MEIVLERDQTETESKMKESSKIREILLSICQFENHAIEIALIQVKGIFMGNYVKNIINKI